MRSIGDEAPLRLEQIADPAAMSIDRIDERPNFDMHAGGIKRREIARSAALHIGGETLQRAQPQQERDR